MATSDDVARVKGNIAVIYERRKAYLYALCLAFAGYAIRNFRARQPAAIGARGRYWVNRTGQAAARMFTSAFKTESVLGWRMSHGVPYGVYLELANNRRNQAIRPTVEKYAAVFFRTISDYLVAGKVDGAPGEL